jgi:hypothetical protein
MRLDRERTKTHNALEKFTNDWTEYGVSIVFYGWTNVKGRPLINILGLSASGRSSFSLLLLKSLQD